MKNIIILVLVGFLTGIAGGFLSGNYIGSYNYKQFENDLQGNYLDNTRIIVEKADEIKVEQTKQIKNVVVLNSEKIVKIYKKNNARRQISKLGNYYRKDEDVKNGLVITSDGWIIVNNFIKGDKNNGNFLDDYNVVDYNDSIYEIDDFKELADVLFLHIKDVSELPVTTIVEEENVEKGEMVIALNQNNDISVSHVSNKKENFIKSSDKFEKELILAKKDGLQKSFLFNISGGLVGLSNNDGKLLSINNFKFEILNLLIEDEVEKPFWGMNYIDLSNVIIASSSIQKKGALIYSETGDAIEKGGIAEKNKIMEGDIITFIDNREINKNNSLNYVLQDYKIGDNVDITYIRDGESEIINVDVLNYN